MGVLINPTGTLFRRVYTEQMVTLDTLNVLQFLLSVIPQKSW